MVRVDGFDLDAWRRAVAEYDPDVLYGETLSNPALRLMAFPRSTAWAGRLSVNGEEAQPATRTTSMPSRAGPAADTSSPQLLSMSRGRHRGHECRDAALIPGAVRGDEVASVEGHRPGRQHTSRTAPVIPPIYQTTTFELDDTSYKDIQGNGGLNETWYSRFNNPTVDAAAESVAWLHGATRALMTSSGMAADRHHPPHAAAQR